VTGWNERLTSAIVERVSIGGGGGGRATWHHRSYRVDAASIAVFELVTGETPRFKLLIERGTELG